MLWGHQGTSNGGFFSNLAGAAALLMVNALPANFTAAADHVGHSTVFLTEGDAWRVTVRPAVRVAQAPETRVTVPTPPDDVSPADRVIPASGVGPVEEPVTTSPPPVTPLPEPPAPTVETNAFGINVQPNGPRKLTILGRSYADAYRSIPFSRAEYRANPAYRHEAAMELLFGQMRPTTVVKQMPDNAIEESQDTLYSPYLMTPSDYWDYPRGTWPYFGFPSGCVWPY